MKISGIVLDYLDASGLAEDTLVIYTADNGYFLGEHGWYRTSGSCTNRRCASRCWPRYPRLGRAGVVADRPALNIDIAPTILDFAGVPLPERMQGTSLRPLMEGDPPDDWRTSALYSYYENSWAFREMAREQMTDPSFRFWTPAPRRPPTAACAPTATSSSNTTAKKAATGSFSTCAKTRTSCATCTGEPGMAGLETELKAELRRLRGQYGEQG